MKLTFLTPLAALVVVTTIVPLAVLFTREQRARRIRRALRLPHPSSRSPVMFAAALASVPALLAVAAAQPVVETTRVRPERSDAEIFFVVDTSRSMLASDGVDGPTRFERAREDVRRLRSAFTDVPIGLASFTDRVLPHVLPTTDARVFLAALHRSIGIDHPPPAFFYAGHATTFAALRIIPTHNFFTPSVRKRVLVVFTDGEAREMPPRSLERAFNRPKRVRTVFVRYWDAGERIYTTGVAEPGYKPDPDLAARINRAAELIDGRVFAASELTSVRAEVRRLIGAGPTRRRPGEGEKLALMPYLTLAALIPLGLVLRRRNL